MGLLSHSYPATFVRLRSLARVYAVSEGVYFCKNLELRTLIIRRPSRFEFSVRAHAKPLTHIRTW